MDADNQEQYEQFLLHSRVDTRLIEFREQTKAGEILRMVSIIDLLDDGLSSVYTFFDPEIPQASFGTCNILWQIAQTQALGLPYLYLGYWVEKSQKMAYKTNFRPIEGFINQIWTPLPKHFLTN